MDEHTVRIAMGQMHVSAGKPHQNLLKACNMIKEASEKNCDVIVLPECMDLGWTYTEAFKLAKSIPGDYSDRLCEAAKDSRICVVVGLTEKYESKLFNSAIFISSNGEILNKHRKINEVDIAHHLYSIGSSVSVTDTDIGVIGINICADNLPNSLAIGHVQARMGAQVILSPSSWAVRRDYDNKKEGYGQAWIQSYKTISRLYNIPIVGVSNVGRIEGGAWDNWKCIGSSLAVGSDGEIIARGTYGETAEEIIPIECTLKKPDKVGTALANSLKEKGYHGP